MSRKEGYSKPERREMENVEVLSILQHQNNAARRCNSINKYVQSVNSAQKTLKEVNLLKTIQISGDEGGLQT